VLRLQYYNGFGLAISVASATLAVLSYTLFGLGPLLALWVGLLVVGVSMVLTPVVEGSKLSDYALAVILNTFENVARAIEGLGVRGRAVYVSSGDWVYIVFGEVYVDDFSRFAVAKGGRVSLVFKSPISAEHLEGLKDPCEAVEYVAVDRLGIAGSVECVDRGGRLYVRFSRPKVYPVKSLERTVGSVYGVLAASVATLTKGLPASIAYESSDERACAVEVVVGEELWRGAS
jgi:hypothetical protein